MYMQYVYVCINIFLVFAKYSVCTFCFVQQILYKYLTKKLNRFLRHPIQLVILQQPQVSQRFLVLYNIYTYIVNKIISKLLIFLCCIISFVKDCNVNKKYIFLIKVIYISVKRIKNYTRNWVFKKKTQVHSNLKILTSIQVTVFFL